MQTIEYRIQPARPAAHLFHVGCTLAHPAPQGQRFCLPAWIPGSYLIRDFARHIVTISAFCNGEPVSIKKCDKQTWECAPCEGSLTVICEIYARDESVRAAFLDRYRAFFNGTSVFLRPEGGENWPCEVHIEPPLEAVEGDWKLATTLPPVAVDNAGFGEYHADNYNHLIDHPVVMGNIDLVEFYAAGKPHGLALLGRHDGDRDRLAQDLAKVCSVHANMFGELPLDAYLFLAQIVGEGYGGLEHRDCSLLQVARNSLPAAASPTKTRSDAYMNFLGLCSHEYFHLWNVKRIQPRAVAESDLINEAHFRDLWAYEGVTSYYDDLALARAGLLSPGDYLKKLATAATRVESTPGRQRQSLSESSFDAWTKFYRPDENTPNAVVSYYGKGGLVALCLDLTLRKTRSSKLSLDRVMQRAWDRFGSANIAVPDGGLERLCVEMADASLEEFFARYVHGTEDPPVAQLLSAFAVNCERVASSSGADAATAIVQAQGLRLAANTNEPRLQYVLDNTPAQQAGLSPSDVLVALDGLRVTPANLGPYLQRREPGERLHLQFFRGDELLSTQLEIAGPANSAWRFTLDDNASAAAKRRRQAWLNGQ